MLGAPPRGRSTHCSQRVTFGSAYRVYCALEEITGSHIPKCVCRDEMRGVEDRAEAVQYLREAQQARQLIHGG